MNLAELNLNVRIYTPSKYKFIAVKGKDNIDLLDRLTTNDLKSLKSMEHLLTVISTAEQKIATLNKYFNNTQI